MAVNSASEDAGEDESGRSIATAAIMNKSVAIKDDGESRCCGDQRGRKSFCYLYLKHNYQVFYLAYFFIKQVFCHFLYAKLEHTTSKERLPPYRYYLLVCNAFQN